MPRPTFLDFVVGHALFILAECGLMVLFWQQYEAGQEDRVILLAIGGFMLLWSYAARSRVVAWHEYRREWQAMEHAGSNATATANAPGMRTRRARRPLPRPVRTAAGIAKWIVILALAPILMVFLSGFAREGAKLWLGRELPDVSAPILAYLAVIDAGMRKTGTAHDPLSVELAALALFVIAGLFVRLVLRSLWRRRAIAAEPWDGTVQIVVPLPK